MKRLPVSINWEALSWLVKEKIVFKVGSSSLTVLMKARKITGDLERFIFYPKIPSAESNTCAHNNPQAPRLRERDGVSDQMPPILSAAGFAARLVCMYVARMAKVQKPWFTSRTSSPSWLPLLLRALFCSNPFNSFNDLESHILLWTPFWRYFSEDLD